MGWIRVSDDFYDNSKLSDVGPLGVALHFAAMGFCNRNLTDGFFRKSKARLFLDFDGIGITTVQGEHFAAGVDGDDAASLVIEWMVAADLWHESGHDCVKCHARADGGEPSKGEYLVHDYFDYQPSKSEVEEKAEANRKRVEAWRSAQKGGGKPSANGSSKAVGNAGSNGVGNALRTEHVTEQYAAGTNPPNPTPTPTVISDEITSKGGGVTGDTHLAADPTTPPQCTRHKTNALTSCLACKVRREWETAQAEAQAADEVHAQRQRKFDRENCPRCKGDNTYLDDRDVARLCRPHLPPLEEAVNG